MSDRERTQASVQQSERRDSGRGDAGNPGGISGPHRVAARPDPRAFHGDGRRPGRVPGQAPGMSTMTSFWSRPAMWKS